MLVGYPPFFDESPYKIYEKILNNKPEFPRFMDSSAKDLIKRLLTSDKMKRLGNLKGGANDIKMHQWFAGVDWADVYNRMIPPPIPVKVSHDADTHYYEKYPEQAQMAVPQLTPEQQSLFYGF